MTEPEPLPVTDDVFDEFAHDPMAYVRAVEPTEEQERVAKELRGLYCSMRDNGFTPEEAMDLTKEYLRLVLAEVDS